MSASRSSRRVRVHTTTGGRPHQRLRPCDPDTVVSVTPGLKLYAAGIALNAFQAWHQGVFAQGDPWRGFGGWVVAVIITQAANGLLYGAVMKVSTSESIGMRSSCVLQHAFCLLFCSAPSNLFTLLRRLCVASYAVSLFSVPIPSRQSVRQQPRTPLYRGHRHATGLGPGTLAARVLSFPAPDCSGLPCDLRPVLLFGGRASQLHEYGSAGLQDAAEKPVPGIGGGPQPPRAAELPRHPHLVARLNRYAVYDARLRIRRRRVKARRLFYDPRNRFKLASADAQQFFQTQNGCMKSHRLTRHTCLAMRSTQQKKKIQRSKRRPTKVAHISKKCLCNKT